MNLICRKLHDYKEDINQGIQPELIFDEDEIIEAYKKHEEEIKAALEKYVRVYLVIISGHQYSGIYHSPDEKQLTKVLNQGGNGFKQNSMVCKLMAFFDKNIESNTKLYLTRILAKQEVIPSTITYSIGNALLEREGIGITEAGK
ncbi:MAG: hypothetical protein GY754_11250 [bacterium]|nr:hypothetical protein [bacterium]